MGIDKPVHGLGDALFSRTQQRVLALFFGSPGRDYYTNEVIRLAGVGTGAAMRELEKLHSAGLLTVSRVGNQKHYRANPDAPIFEELRAIVRKTFGLADTLREVLAPLADQMELAFIYGSVAAGEDTASSDVDLLIIGRDLSYAELMSHLVVAEATLHRQVSPTIYSRSELDQKLAEDNAFVVRLLERDKIFLVGSPHELRDRQPRPLGRNR